MFSVDLRMFWLLFASLICFTAYGKKTEKKDEWQIISPKYRPQPRSTFESICNGPNSQLLLNPGAFILSTNWEVTQHVATAPGNCVQAVGPNYVSWKARNCYVQREYNSLSEAVTQYWTSLTAQEWTSHPLPSTVFSFAAVPDLGCFTIWTNGETEFSNLCTDPWQPLDTAVPRPLGIHYPFPLYPTYDALVTIFVEPGGRNNVYQLATTAASNTWKWAEVSWQGWLNSTCVTTEVTVTAVPTALVHKANTWLVACNNSIYFVTPKTQTPVAPWLGAKQSRWDQTPRYMCCTTWACFALLAGQWSSRGLTIAMSKTPGMHGTWKNITNEAEKAANFVSWNYAEGVRDPFRLSCGTQDSAVLFGPDGYIRRFEKGASTGIITNYTTYSDASGSSVPGKAIKLLPGNVLNKGDQWVVINEWGAGFCYSDIHKKWRASAIPPKGISLKPKMLSSQILEQKSVVLPISTVPTTEKGNTTYFLFLDNLHVSKTSDLTHFTSCALPKQIVVDSLLHVMAVVEGALGHTLLLAAQNSSSGIVQLWSGTSLGLQTGSNGDCKWKNISSLFPLPQTASTPSTTMAMVTNQIGLLGNFVLIVGDQATIYVYVYPSGNKTQTRTDHVVQKVATQSVVDGPPMQQPLSVPAGKEVYGWAVDGEQTLYVLGKAVPTEKEMKHKDKLPTLLQRVQYFTTNNSLEIWTEQAFNQRSPRALGYDRWNGWYWLRDDQSESTLLVAKAFNSTPHLLPVGGPVIDLVTDQKGSMLLQYAYANHSYALALHDHPVNSMFQCTHWDSSSCGGHGYLVGVVMGTFALVVGGVAGGTLALKKYRRRKWEETV